MVKMNLHSEFEDPQIQRLNEFFLVADRIRKAGRNPRQGLGKFKKPSPNGGGARLSAPASNENLLFTKGSFAPPTQGSRKVPSESNFFPQEIRSAKMKQARSKRRRPRLLSTLRRNASSQARTRKQSRRGAMAGSAKDTPNGHLQRSSTKASRHELK
jgi:hypothetical protein